MPGLGDQPNPQVVVFNGSPVTPSPVHAYATGFSDGGPSPNQIYLNHIIKTLNQITASYGITRFSLVGHSGGANVAAMLAAMDSRLKNVQLLQGGWYQATNPDTDVETWIYNPAVELASFATTPAIHWMYTTAASMPHRMTVVHSSPTDPQYDFGEGAAAEFEHWKEWGTRVQEYFSNWASVTTRKKTGPGHGPDPDQAKFIEDCLLANAFNN
jgi:pimeloyl-ACP methyl ester carboxylesterase